MKPIILILALFSMTANARTLTAEQIQRNEQIARMLDDEPRSEYQLGPDQYGSVPTYNEQEKPVQPEPIIIIKHLRPPPAK